MAPPAQPPSSAPAYGNFRLASRPENNGPSNFRPASASANGTPLGNSKPPGAFTVFVRPSAVTHEHPSDAQEVVYSPPSSDNQTPRVSQPQVPRASLHQTPRVSSPLALHVSTPPTVSAPSSIVVEPSETAPDTMILDDESAPSEIVDDPLFLGPDVVSTDEDRDIDIQPCRPETSNPLDSFPSLSISREPPVRHDQSPAIAKAHFATDTEGSPLRDIVIDSGAAITLMNAAYANEHLPTLTRHRLEKFQLGLGAADCASFLMTDLHFPTAEGGKAVIPANFYLANTESARVILGNDILHPMGAQINLGSLALRFRHVAGTIPIECTTAIPDAAPTPDPTTRPDAFRLRQRLTLLPGHQARVARLPS
ncbi:hypothetical protein L198_01878 [Cryptococcus wingfieldii CBS 7118]|uniref:Uncharacterized protein n=1 Tax=Cryptococcus wingfieldii CBS 7118 TaxID=1295528 RepID=A0A1E3JWF3_9TREE|nr:hypothetical protein L198_01878 [Cryptococcus wingfieldii CBS 7118]ODO05189.1 hypothetical protein L198_01878 [Cryptococcus wingfieldii CBS 7118]